MDAATLAQVERLKVKLEHARLIGDKLGIQGLEAQIRLIERAALREVRRLN